jgi:large subunit ribosomal protein L18e
MGIDLGGAGGRTKKVRRTRPVSDNAYLSVLVKLYQYLNRRTGSRFNSVVLKRLCQSRVNRASVSVRQVAKAAKANPGKIVVVVSSVLDDARVEVVPKVTLAALRVSETARARIEKNGGEVITFDQLALRTPLGAKTVLLRGRKNTREVTKHFGTPGAKNSHAKPYVRSKGNKFEQARGRKVTFRA